MDDVGLALLSLVWMGDLARFRESGMGCFAFLCTNCGIGDCSNGIIGGAFGA
jgi:hypothetical protein